MLPPTLQLSFSDRLERAKRTYLLPALLNEVAHLDIGRLDQELIGVAGRDRLAFVAHSGLRGELVFPVPYLLQSNPALLGYYCLLLGFSQKQFYVSPFGRFKRLEAAGVLTTATSELLRPLCDSLAESAWILVNGLRSLSQQLLNSLTLLTLGPQFRGSRNVGLGADAVRLVFTLIRSIAAGSVVSEDSSRLEIRSAAQRMYIIEFAPDPDIALRQVLADGSLRNRLAVEVKGGTDFSNIHNRLGESEKSHQKAKAEGFTQFWTVVNVPDLDSSVWRRETPTTNELFYLGSIIDPRSSEYRRFREYLIAELGI